MLSLRPSCENCATLLPPNSTQAMICSFECTFCDKCVTNVLHNVCPNCGGGFSPRPVRPASNHVNTASLQQHPASEAIVEKPINASTHATLIKKLAGVLPQNR